MGSAIKEEQEENKNEISDSVSDSGEEHLDQQLDEAYQLNIPDEEDDITNI